jgi:FkbM family methyltransferase
MVEVVINGRWPLMLPVHRAERAEWSSPAGWERAKLDSIHANLRPGDVVYDVGAEEGDESALYALWVGPSGGVVLFEPNAKVWPNIRVIFEANALSRPMVCWSGFASNVDTPSALDAIEPGWPESAYGPVIGDHGFQSLVEREQSLPNIRLDTIAGPVGPPDAIMIDVEGAELRVLHGAARVLAERRPLVWVSVHPTMLGYDYQANPEDVHVLMMGHGYRMHLLAQEHENQWLYWPAERDDVVLP